jgi:hypothetical protein
LNEIKHNTGRPNLRWRIVPGFFFAGLGLLLVGGFARNLFLGVPFMHPAHFLVFVAGVVWTFAAVEWFRGKWWLAVCASVVGFILPFLRPIP